MSVANGMWYQSESKLKMPRSRASLAVRPQWANTRATIPSVINSDQLPGPRVLSEVEGGAAGGVVLDPPPPPPPAGGADSDEGRASRATAPANARDIATRVQP